ncbi:Hypothetical predicted protein, partial [Marmota monax]
VANAATSAAAKAQYKGAPSEAGCAKNLMKKWEEHREQMEQRKQQIAEENIMKSNIDKKFCAHYDAVKAQLKSSTVGLEEEEGGEKEEEVAMHEEELEREEITPKRRKLGKNPDVDTSFLPDQDREKEGNRLQEEL